MTSICICIGNEGRNNNTYSTCNDCGNGIGNGNGNGNGYRYGMVW